MKWSCKLNHKNINPIFLNNKSKNKIHLLNNYNKIWFKKKKLLLTLWNFRKNNNWRKKVYTYKQIIKKKKKKYLINLSI